MQLPSKFRVPKMRKKVIPQVRSTDCTVWSILFGRDSQVLYKTFHISVGRNNSLGLYSLSRGGRRIIFMLEYTPFMNLRLSEYTSTVSHLPHRNLHRHLHQFKKVSPLWSPSYSLIRSSGSHHCNYIFFTINFHIQGLLDHISGRFWGKVG